MEVLKGVEKGCILRCLESLKVEFGVVEGGVVEVFVIFLVVIVYESGGKEVLKLKGKVFLYDGEKEWRLKVVIVEVSL